MVRIVTLVREYVLSRWLCPRHVELAILGGWSRYRDDVVPPHPLACEERAAGGCTSGWVEPPPRAEPAPAELGAPEIAIAKMPVRIQTRYEGPRARWDETARMAALLREGKSARQAIEIIEREKGNAC